MKKHALRLGVLVVLAAAVSAPIAFGAAARTAAAPVNLIRNGGAERGSAVTNDTAVVAAIPGWTRTGEFTVVKYGSPGGFPDHTVSTAIKGGKNFFAGGPANPHSGATQDISLSRFATAIDKGTMTATLSGDLGGYSSQRDSLTVTATFKNAAGASLGSIHIGPVTTGQRHNTTGLIIRKALARVRPQTRTVHVAVHAVRTDGSYNDGYADNLSLTLTKTP
jgi:hypothetical protein